MIAVASAEPSLQSLMRKPGGDRLTYRADIDGIRAIAVLLVVVFHFDLVAFGAAGFVASTCSS